jgi:hypothetical protein
MNLGVTNLEITQGSMRMMICLKLVKDENGNMLADSHNKLNGWKNYFSVIDCT